MWLRNKGNLNRNLDLVSTLESRWQKRRGLSIIVHVDLFVNIGRGLWDDKSTFIQSDHDYNSYFNIDSAYLSYEKENLESIFRKQSCVFVVTKPHIVDCSSNPAFKDRSFLYFVLYFIKMHTLVYFTAYKYFIHKSSNLSLAFISHFIGELFHPPS